MELLGVSTVRYEKVLHGHSDWLENLYFDFVFMLRATCIVCALLMAFIFVVYVCAYFFVFRLLVRTVFSRDA